MTNYIYVGDAKTCLPGFPAASFQSCMTSPPYYSLRDYGAEGQIGLEESVEEYIDALMQVFREVYRTLRDDGTLWVNLGDSYAGSGLGWSKDPNSMQLHNKAWAGRTERPVNYIGQGQRVGEDMKARDLMGIPWAFAFAMRKEGWYLRSECIEEVELYCPCGCGFVLEERIWRYAQDRDIIWSKPAPMPESVTNRPTKSHEYLFLFTKSPDDYYYNADAIRTPLRPKTLSTYGSFRASEEGDEQNRLVKSKRVNATMKERKPRLDAQGNPVGANKRSVWTVAREITGTEHTATFPKKLAEPCILASTRPGDRVLDPFAGTGTVGVVCTEHNRDFVGCEINAETAQTAYKRLDKTQPLLPGMESQ